MLTKPDLCSMALLKLGEQPIQSFQDDTASAKLARTLFDSVIDTLLLQHPWHFATTEIRLIKNSNNEFLIPANVLRVLKTDGRILKKMSDFIMTTTLPTPQNCNRVVTIQIASTSPKVYQQAL